MSSVIKCDDFQQRAGGSTQMEASFIDFWHIAECCLNSGSGLIDVDRASQVIVWSLIAVMLLIVSG